MGAKEFEGGTLEYRAYGLSGATTTLGLRIFGRDVIRTWGRTARSAGGEAFFFSTFVYSVGPGPPLGNRGLGVTTLVGKWDTHAVTVHKYSTLLLVGRVI